jgi:hypothetical protein
MYFKFIAFIAYKLHYEERHNFFAKLRRMRWAEHLERMAERYGAAHKIVFRMPEGKKQLRRTRHRWENNIKIYLKNISCEDAGQIHLAQGRVNCRSFVNKVMNRRFT